MEGKWTKGPWQKSGARCASPAYKGHGVGPDGQSYVVIVPYNDRDHHECLANARLIAQAPAMAEALEAFVAACETAPPVDLIAHIGAACEKAKAVLTAIKGE